MIFSECREPGSADDEELEGAVEVAEDEKPKENFTGQDAEVTVRRSNGQMEGGWEVFGPSEKRKGYLTVCNREKNIK